MPLLTDDIEQARLAFSVLETRTLTAEQRADGLHAAVADLQARLPLFERDEALLRQRISALEAEIIRLQGQLDQLAQLSTATSLQNFIASMGLAAAVGEATMMDRVIPSITVTLQANLGLGSNGVQVRFQPAELGAVASGLSATSFELTKVPPAAGTTAPRSLYVVLQEKQQLFTDPFFARFAQAVPIIVTVGKLLADTGGWTFPSLVQQTVAVAALEKGLAQAATTVAPTDRTAAYAAAVDALAALVGTFGSKPVPVAGDLFALTTAIDATTAVARRIKP